MGDLLLPCGRDLVIDALIQGLQPDPVLWLDAWSVDNVELPREISNEYGRYDPDRTVGARTILQWLSPAHPCQRVVVVGPSQFLKTQVAINAICGWMAAAPANILALEPTGGLAKRLSSRIAKQAAKCMALDGKLAEERSRDARNTIDTKEFDGGTLYITTAGSASNLAEVPARYIFGDEIDKWDGDVEGEGDPVKVTENRTTSYRYSRKMYYASSPRKGRKHSRIMRLYEQGTQCVVEVPCPHCGDYHELTGEHFHYDEELTRAWFVCPGCGAEIDEHHKELMFSAHRVTARAAGDGETESIHLSAYLMPPGRITWLDCAKELQAALIALEAGVKDPHALLKTYRNTREAVCYDVGVEAANPLELANRAEDYPELTVPAGGLVLTAGVDVQHDRLAVVIRAWGRGEESWLVHWGEIQGQTLVPLQGAWLDLEKLLYGEGVIRHEWGANMRIAAQSIDSGDGATQEAVLSFVRKWLRRGAMATKGASERGFRKKEIFSAPPPSIDLDRKHKASKYGLKTYFVGTHAAKNLILKVRLPLTGRGNHRMHWYKSVRSDYWNQLCSEVEVPGKRAGETSWDVKSGVRNEGLDCEVLNLHAARSLRLHLTQEHVWAGIEAQLRQAALFTAAQDEEIEPEQILLAPSESSDRTAPQQEDIVAARIASASLEQPNQARASMRRVRSRGIRG